MQTDLPKGLQQKKTKSVIQITVVDKNVTKNYDPTPTRVQFLSI